MGLNDEIAMAFSVDRWDVGLSRFQKSGLNLAKEIAGPEAAARAARLADPDYPYLD